jgi:hypothetical protein
MKSSCYFVFNHSVLLCPSLYSIFIGRLLILQLRTCRGYLLPIVFGITSLHGPHGKYRLLLLRMRVYSFVSWQQSSGCSVRLFGANRIENSFLHIVFTFLRGDVYRPSHRNGSSSIVTCIRCRENVYGHSSVVIETARMSQYVGVNKPRASTL